MCANWLGRCSRAITLVPAVLVAWLFVFAGPAGAQQQGAIAGTVVDSETLQPVAGAQVYIPGTVVGTLTSQAGTFRLEGVPVGQATVEVRLIGYKDIQQTVTVQAGQVATADFQVEQTALRLQDIVVTGVVAETPRVKLPFTVERLDPDDLPVPASNAATLLKGKAAGVSAVSGSGQPGTSADITLRGPTSIDASGRTQQPLIVIDGVIQSDRGTLADINALDIDHVEIVKGAAAASLYGSRAQNGVIQISTKRGQNLATNTFDVIVRGEYGVSNLENAIALSQFHGYGMNASQTKFLLSDGTEVDLNDLGRLGSATNGGGPTCDNLTETCTPDNTFQISGFPEGRFDHIDRFFDPGETSSLYAAVTGRFGESSFRASFENFREQGVIKCTQCSPIPLPGSADSGGGIELFNPVRDDGYTRRNARVNVDSRLGSQINIAASGFYSNSKQDDSAIAAGSFFSLTFMSPGFDLTDTGEDAPEYQEFFDGLPRIDIDPLSQEENPLYQLAIRDNTDRNQRVMGSLDASWAPLNWLSFEGNASYDRTDFNEVNITPKSTKRYDGSNITFNGGSLATRNFFEDALNVSGTASANYTWDSGLTARAKFRYLYEEQSFEQVSSSGTQFSVGETPNFNAISGTKDADNSFQEIKSNGLFLIASADYKGRYIVDGLIRRDGSSLFGPDERWHTYWRGSLAWRISQEDFWNIDGWNEFKIRGSIGTAGGRPNFFAQYETFGISAGQVFPVNLGNTALKPERTQEREIGANFVFINKISFDIQYAWADTDDQLLRVPLPGFVGFSSQWQNAGEVAAKTWEASLRWAAIDNSDVGLNFRVIWDRTRNEITRLDVPAFTRQRQFVAEGEEIGAIWGSRWSTTCSEAAGAAGILGTEGFDCTQFQTNSDGFLVWVGDGNTVNDGVSKDLWGTTGDVAGTTFKWGQPIKAKAQRRTCLNENGGSADEATCPLSDFLPIGSGTPDWNGAFATNFRYRGLAVALLVDTRVGHDLYNQTRQWAFRENRGEEMDQAGLPDNLIKPQGYYQVLYDTNSTSANFIEDGTWVKFRELSLGYSLPQSFMQSAFKGTVDRVTINLIGRNLFTFTDYQGYDPEVGVAGGSVGSTSLNTQDAFGYPNFRTFTASLEVVF